MTAYDNSHALAAPTATHDDSPRRRSIAVQIRRQMDDASAPYWEAFVLPYKPNMNIISVLNEIQANPVNTDGQKVLPTDEAIAALIDEATPPDVKRAKLET